MSVYQIAGHIQQLEKLQIKYITTYFPFKIYAFQQLYQICTHVAKQGDRENLQSGQMPVLEETQR